MTTETFSSLRTVVLVVYDGCQSLDVMGPVEVFRKANQHAAVLGVSSGYDVRLVSLDGKPVCTSSGVFLGPCVSILDCMGEVDTVLVSGGISDAVETGASAEQLHHWIRARVASARRIGSVCTGAFALAAAGLLDGKRATTHWHSCDRLARSYPAIHVVPDAIFVSDPPVFTSAGITAAIDLSLAFVEADLGKAVALAVARELVVYLRRPGGQSQFSAGLRAQAVASSRIRELLASIVENPEQDLNTTALAEKLSVSERHLVRLFRQETGMSPAKFVEAARADRAKLFLEQTQWPVYKVAERSGFGSVDGLQRSFQRRFSLTPEEYRCRFT